MYNWNYQLNLIDAHGVVSGFFVLKYVVQKVTRSLFWGGLAHTVMQLY